MNYVNMIINIYERLDFIKSGISQIFNSEYSISDDAYNYSHYRNQYNDYFYNPYTILENEIKYHQQERDEYNERLEEQFNNAMNENINNRQAVYSSFSNININNNLGNNNDNESHDNSVNETVSIMPKHVVDELKSLYDSNQTYPDCSICLEPLCNFKMLSCGHKFCSSCLSNIDKCAFCRKCIQK